MATDVGTVSDKRRGPRKISWEYEFADELERRLRLGEACETLEEECEHLALWFAARHRPAVGEKERPITAGRLREKYRTRNPGGAKHYKRARQAHIARLLNAARAFLEQFPEYK